MYYIKSFVPFTIFPCILDDELSAEEWRYSWYNNNHHLFDINFLYSERNFHIIYISQIENNWHQHCVRSLCTRNCMHASCAELLFSEENIDTPTPESSSSAVSSMHTKCHSAEQTNNKKHDENQFLNKMTLK